MGTPCALRVRRGQPAAQEQGTSREHCASQLASQPPCTHSWGPHCAIEPANPAPGQVAGTGTAQAYKPERTLGRLRRQAQRNAKYKPARPCACLAARTGTMRDLDTQHKAGIEDKAKCGSTSCSRHTGKQPGRVLCRARHKSEHCGKALARRKARGCGAGGRAVIGRGGGAEESVRRGDRVTKNKGQRGQNK